MAVKWWNTRPSAQAVAVDIQFAGMMINTIHIPEGYCMDLSERGVLRIVKQQQPQGEK